jgi:hypothetical protein
MVTFLFFLLVVALIGFWPLVFVVGYVGAKKLLSRSSKGGPK